MAEAAWFLLIAMEAEDGILGAALGAEAVLVGGDDLAEVEVVQYSLPEQKLKKFTQNVDEEYRSEGFGIFSVSADFQEERKYACLRHAFIRFPNNSFYSEDDEADEKIIEIDNPQQMDHLIKSTTVLKEEEEISLSEVTLTSLYNSQFPFLRVISEAKETAEDDDKTIENFEQQNITNNQLPSTLTSINLESPYFTVISHAKEYSQNDDTIEIIDIQDDESTSSNIALPSPRIIAYVQDSSDDQILKIVEQENIANTSIQSDKILVTNNSTVNLTNTKLPLLRVRSAARVPSQVNRKILPLLRKTTSSMVSKNSQKPNNEVSVTYSKKSSEVIELKSSIIKNINNPLVARSINESDNDHSPALNELISEPTDVSIKIQRLPFTVYPPTEEPILVSNKIASKVMQQLKTTNYATCSIPKPCISPRDSVKPKVTTELDDIVPLILNKQTTNLKTFANPTVQTTDPSDKAKKNRRPIRKARPTYGQLLEKLRKSTSDYEENVLSNPDVQEIFKKWQKPSGNAKTNQETTKMTNHKSTCPYEDVLRKSTSDYQENVLSTDIQEVFKKRQKPSGNAKTNQETRKMTNHKSTCPYEDVLRESTSVLSTDIQEIFKKWQEPLNKAKINQKPRKKTNDKPTYDYQENILPNTEFQSNSVETQKCSDSIDYEKRESAKSSENGEISKSDESDIAEIISSEPEESDTVSEMESEESDNEKDEIKNKDPDFILSNELVTSSDESYNSDFSEESLFANEEMVAKTKIAFDEFIVNLIDSPDNTRCDSCGQAFGTCLELGLHSIQHHEDNILLCPVCHIGVENESCLKNHLKDHDRFQCKKCNKTMRDEIKAYTHVRQYVCQEQIVECYICEKKMAKKLLAEHKLTHKGENNAHKCSLCSIEFKNSRSLKYHFITKHKELGLQTNLCELCGKDFPTKSSYKVHMRQHEGIKDFACTECDWKFYTNFGLKKHMAIHSGERNYSCDICGKRYKHRSVLECHKKTHTGERINCPICDRPFVLKHNMKVHMKICTGVYDPDDPKKKLKNK